MRRHYFPSILLYGLGFTLAISLSFNGFLLFEQTRQRSVYEFELANATTNMDTVFWRQQLSDCLRTSQQKDSLIRQLAQSPNAPPHSVPIAKPHSH